MPKDAPTDALAEGIREVVRTDDVIKARLASFLTLALDEAEFTIRHGAAPLKARLIQSVISNAVRDSSRRADEDETRAKSREEFLVAFGAIQGALNMPQRKVVVEAAPEDVPH